MQRGMLLYSPRLYKHILQDKRLSPSCPTPQAATGFTKMAYSYEAPKPVAPGFRVCSDHFREVDYIYKPVKYTNVT